ncbi:MAG: AAA family ATPase, partial [Spirochaetia bacterium]|nr:AAA family ATPase [Spirochaetia bacterium]
MFVCDACGNETTKWEGRCGACGEWNTLKQFREAAASSSKQKPAKRGPKTVWQKADDIVPDESDRLKTGITELDHVLGGGLARGSVTLLSGEPGIGKSTLLLHLAGKIREKILFVAGEETLA